MPFTAQHLNTFATTPSTRAILSMFARPLDVNQVKVFPTAPCLSDKINSVPQRLVRSSKIELSSRLVMMAGATVNQHSHWHTFRLPLKSTETSATLRLRNRFTTLI